MALLADWSFYQGHYIKSRHNLWDRVPHSPFEGQCWPLGRKADWKGDLSFLILLLYSIWSSTIALNVFHFPLQAVFYTITLHACTVMYNATGRWLIASMIPKRRILLSCFHPFIVLGTTKSCICMLYESSNSHHQTTKQPQTTNLRHQ